ncbi:ArsR/SmtB family transcription factor [Allokutzneria albata]|uniref:DNA-binding transcriptional regulator, ArsR family n=1 Tax=Allokutzneria albata TaxID=211114 RepID=A0A1G9UXB8_ALLAB|nr:helix-turn-helix domain-containing protein [Allokutzneria albata]SDM64500.1 DNA-binding transcriptional regulator, ArsR family [Allokutzneria albata]
MTAVGPELAALAGLLADETRAAMCLALLDKRAWTAGELAQLCGVARSTASEHISKLIAGGLLDERRQGRHRYVRLADDDVASLIETMSAHVRPAAVSGLRQHRANAALARGRTCYDHLAGRLGVAITDAMTTRGLLRRDTGFALTAAGLDWFAELGMSLPDREKRPLVRSCLDWTERRDHLAGPAAARLCQVVLEREWAVRIGSKRAVRVTPLGLDELRRHLGIEAAELGS